MTSKEDLLIFLCILCVKKKKKKKKLSLVTSGGFPGKLIAGCDNQKCRTETSKDTELMHQMCVGIQSDPDPRFHLGISLH